MSAKLDAALKAFAVLGHPERNEFFRSIIEKMPAVPSDWLTLEEAAEALDRDKSSVSRYIRHGKLISNGKQGGKGLRVLRGSVIHMQLKVSLKLLKEMEADRPEVHRAIPDVEAAKSLAAETISKQLAKSGL